MSPEQKLNLVFAAYMSIGAYTLAVLIFVRWLTRS